MIFCTCSYCTRKKRRLFFPSIQSRQKREEWAVSRLLGEVDLLFKIENKLQSLYSELEKGRKQMVRLSEITIESKRSTLTEQSRPLGKTAPPQEHNKTATKTTTKTTTNNKSRVEEVTNMSGVYLTRLKRSESSPRRSLSNFSVLSISTFCLAISEAFSRRSTRTLVSFP